MSEHFDWYRGNLDWLPCRTILLTRHGSHAYGTATASSDLDIKGVAVPPREYFLGFNKRFEQAESRGDPDAVIYDIRKFFALAADCNPNIIEILHTDESDLINYTDAGWLMRCYRSEFLSQKAKHTFSGYAVSQLKRIKTHRRWLMHPPSHKPERAEYGLPDHSAIPKEQREALESMMLKMIDGWQVDLACVDDATRIDLLSKLAIALADMKLSADDQYIAAGNKLGLNTQAMELLKGERTYRAALAEWTQYQTWLRERNEVRAGLERSHGYDTKHGMHLVRLMRMCREILKDGLVIVKRPDAAELLSIRNGAWSYDRLIGWANETEAELEELQKRSWLPRAPNRPLLDSLCMEIVESVE